MADKQHSDTKEKIETSSYSPGLKDSGDLEIGTHTIVPTTRPAIGSAQYSKSLTLPKPGDARLAVKRIAARLSVNIAGLGTATHIYLSVRVDVDNADYELFTEDWTSIGAKLDAVDTHSGNKATLFNLLKDGAAHTFYFLFWADAASQATIDVVQLWEAVGSSATNINQFGCLQLTHSGFISDMILFITQGSGTSNFRRQPTTDGAAYFSSDSSVYGRKSISNLLINNLDYNVAGAVATDLNYIDTIIINLRSEQ